MSTSPRMTSATGRITSRGGNVGCCCTARRSASCAERSLTAAGIVPLRMYLKDGLAKVEIALVRGKRLYDKKDAVAERDMDRDLRRAVKDGDYE